LIDDINKELGLYTLTNERRAQLEAEKTRLSARLAGLLSSGGVGAISGAGTAAITSSGWND